VMNAPYAAGGPDGARGFRSVQGLRAGRLVTTLHLYDYLLAGNTRSDVRLEQGEVCSFSRRGGACPSRAPVVRPALYDLTEGQDLRELIQISGGLLPQAYTGQAQIQRVLPPDQRPPSGRDRTLLDVDLQAVLRPGATPFRVEPADSIIIFAVSIPVRDRVAVKATCGGRARTSSNPGKRSGGSSPASGASSPTCIGAGADPSAEPRFDPALDSGESGWNPAPGRARIRETGNRALGRGCRQRDYWRWIPIFRSSTRSSCTQRPASGPAV